jgi:hypothetical protein
MPNVIKIAFFWLAVWCAIKLLQRKPHSVLARIAFSWHGPFPGIGEKRSSFYFRQMRFALGWLVELLCVSAAIYIAAWLIPAVGAAETFLLICSFALTIGIGMALLGSFLATLVAVKALVLGPNPEFVMAVKFKDHDEADEEYG